MATHPLEIAAFDAAGKGARKYIARQPVFDRQRAVFGYELLFRSGLDNYFKPQDSQLSTERVVDNFLMFGLHTLTGGKRALINCTRKALVRGYPFLLPSDRVVFELLEDIPPDREVLDACRRLKEAGYMLAFDDYREGMEIDPFLPFLDIIKVDFLATPAGEREPLVRRFKSERIQLLAEKVESGEDVLEAVNSGYTYLQGFFYCRPEMLTTRDVPGFRPNYLRILQAINRPAIDIREVEDILRREPSLLYKLLRFLNSAYFALRSTVTSIRHALVLLGESSLRKWVSLVALAHLAANNPQELVVTALVRARFCESLASVTGMNDRETDMFLLGLLSVMDAILSRPMPEVVEEIPLAEDLKQALLGESNRLGTMLGAVVAYERGDWHVFQSLAADLGLDESAVPEAFLQSVEWARTIYVS